MPLQFTIEDLLQTMIEKKASDLILHTGIQPQIRLDSVLIPLEEYPHLNAEQSKKLIYSLLTEQDIEHFEAEYELDKSFSLAKISRFRGNIFFHRGTVAAAIRAIPHNVPGFVELGLPQEQLISIGRKKRGLFLVTGATGSGKSTTLAAMIEHINVERGCHIVTIEDPIEFIYKSKKSVISQREIGTDTFSFKQGLKYVLRQNPDVILIGEMRDLESIQAALNIAETGHLVFATLHTSTAVQTINRIIDVFPPNHQQQVRTQLSSVLVGTISQILIPKSNTQGMCLATEIMLVNFAMRTLIREEKEHQIFSLIQTGRKDGMKTMNQSLYNLYKQGMITYQDAYLHVTDKNDFKRFFKES
ncbi:MAG: type IV pili twitching motility protein PilT [Candidatus Omnitrophota bacterium]|nr:MAG: type IV pili twitching motility protein PilT [Candidatus Omnitrophota bacterium]